jgi:hypothetical protein
MPVQHRATGIEGENLNVLHRLLSQYATSVPGTLTNNTVSITGLRIGDVLEVPGTAITSVGFGTNDVTVATPENDYVFNNVTFAQNVNEYTAAPDPNTGLMAITFSETDTFTVADQTLQADYLWSDAAEWSDGLPVDGAGVDAPQGGEDNIVGLTLASLGGGLVNVDLTDLTVGTVNTSQLFATTGSGASTHATVTAGTIALAFGEYVAEGVGATFIDKSATDQGEHFAAQDGGMVEVDAPPNVNSEFTYTALGTIALFAPAATTTSNFNRVNAADVFTGVDFGDVLELPGTAVSDVTFGGNLTVTTNAGSYAFTNFRMDSSVSTYRAALDPNTGLVAITFLGTDTFTPPVNQPGSADYLLTAASEWSDGLPIDGDSVSTAVYGIDNIPGLSLATVSGAEWDVIAPSLNVGTLSAALGAEVAPGSAAATVTVGTITGGRFFGAFGPGTVFDDESATDNQDDTFSITDGGLVGRHSGDRRQHQYQHHQY